MTAASVDCRVAFWWRSKTIPNSKPIKTSSSGELRSFFDKDLKSELQVLEAERIKKANKVRSLALILGVLILASPGLFLLFGFFSLVPAVGPIFIWIVLLSRTTRGYASDFKAKVFARIVESIDRDLSYDPAGFISQSDYMASGIFRREPDRYRGDDLVTGRLGKTEIAFSEIHSEYKTTTHSKTGSETGWNTIFRGLFFIANFNKSFKGETNVLPEAAQKVFGKILGNLFQSWNRGRGQLEKMEDPRFEKISSSTATTRSKRGISYRRALRSVSPITRKKQRTSSTCRLSIIGSTWRSPITGIFSSR